jgi:hypothetical protein
LEPAIHKPERSGNRDSSFHDTYFGLLKFNRREFKPKLRKPPDFRLHYVGNQALSSGNCRSSAVAAIELCISKIQNELPT